jgi:hypothetical protein
MAKRRTFDAGGQPWQRNLQNVATNVAMEGIAVVATLEFFGLTL